MRRGRIAQITVAVPERAFLDLGEQVRRGGVRGLEFREAHVSGDHRHLRQHGTRRGGGSRQDLRGAELETDGIANPGLVPREVAPGDQPAVALLSGFDLASHASAVETVVAAVSDGLERAREVRLLQDRSHRRRLAVGQEDARGLGILRQARAVLLAREGAEHRFRDDEAVAGELHGRVDQGFPREAPGPAVRERQSGH